jgi:putative endonuclease
MWFSKKQGATLPVARAGQADPCAVAGQSGQVTTKRLGDAAEQLAQAYLLRAGLTLVETNYRTPGRGGGEVDLIMRAADGTLVFVEVRQRKSSQYGGAAASVGAIKQGRLVFAARHYLLRFASAPPCRFDVVLVQASRGADEIPTIEWLPGAFEAD